MDGLMAYVLSKKHTDSAIREILDAGFKVQVEQDRSILSGTGQQMTLYLIPKESSLSTDTYDEYVYTNKWEQIGSTDINLNYNDLENKPRINGYELSGNKTAEYFGLQPSITVSATLKNLSPVLYTYQLTKYTKIILPRWLYISEDVSQSQITVEIQDNIFRSININNPWATYSFNQFEKEYAYCGTFTLKKRNLIDAPTFISELDDDIRITHLFSPASSLIMRIVSGNDLSTGTVRFFVQNATTTKNSDNSYTISNQTTWKEIGEKGPKGDPGDDYVLTAQDKTDIANIVLGELPTTQGVLYGNTSN